MSRTYGPRAALRWALSQWRRNEINIAEVRRSPKRQRSKPEGQSWGRGSWCI